MCVFCYSLRVCYLPYCPLDIGSFRQQIQHFTNQLAKETNKHLKDLGFVSPSSAPSEQVSVRSNEIVSVTDSSTTTTGNLRVLNDSRLTFPIGTDLASDSPPPQS